MTLNHNKFHFVESRITISRHKDLNRFGEYYRIVSIERIKLYVLHLNQDSPKKCTAKKIVRFKLAKLYKRIKDVPPGSIILSPFSNKVLSPSDRRTAERRGLTVVDCSWKKAHEVFWQLNGNFRRLPYLVAVNPTNFGHPWQLSSVEALAGALYVLGFKYQAEELLNIFKWGPNFITVNREPLELYSKAGDYREVLRYEQEFI